MTLGRGALALLSAGLLCATTPAVAQQPAAQEVLVIEGRGYGHGVGMAQVSAQAMARAGQSREQILSHFYPGTGRGVGSATLAVAVWEAGASSGDVSVRVPDGARISGSAPAVQARPGALLRVSADVGGYHVREQPEPQVRGAALRTALVAQESPSPSPSASASPLPSALPTSSPSASPSPSPTRSGSPRPTPRPSSSTSPSGSPSPTAVPGPLLSYDSSSPVTLTPPDGGRVQVAATGRAYRGELRALAAQGFRLVNLVDVETYLRGLGEVPASWPAAALEAQAVAARTYALRSVGQGRPLGYDICDDTRCQVYLGTGGEATSTTAAARATRGEVVTYAGRLADTFYSANAGGRTASPGEGFGGTSTSPYLPSNRPAAGDVDAYTVSPAPAAVAARLGYPGQLAAVVVSARGPSGRVMRVRLEGTAGARELTGVDVARRLGLRSTLFAVRRGVGTAQQLAAPSQAVTQLSPDRLATELAAPNLPAVAAPPATSRAPARLAGTLPALPVGVATALVLVLAVGVAASGGLRSTARAVERTGGGSDL